MRRVRIIQRSAILAFLLAFLLALLLALLGVAPALAGGWAVVTLDGVPQGIQAGQRLSLGFMVRQHGVTPIDTPYGAGGPPLAPILTARNAATGEAMRAEGRKEGPLGHFVVDFVAPAAGSWTWQIEPQPFAATDLGTLTVLPAGAPPAPVSEPVVGPVAASFSPAPLREGLRRSGILLLLLACGLGLWSRRATLTRHAVGAR